MARLAVGFQGAPGVIRDINPELLGANILSNANGVRLARGASHRVLDPALLLNATGITPNWLLPVDTAAGPLWLITTDTKVYSLTGSSLQHISKVVGGYSASGRWSGGVLSGIPVITNGVDVPQAWTPVAASQLLTDLPNWPPTHRAIVMRSFGVVLIVLGMVVAGVVKPWTVKVSHPADPGALPVSWDEADPTRDVLLFDLADTTDKLVDGMQLGEIFIVYKENSTWTLRTYRGQSLSQLFQVNNIFRESGLLARDCIQSVRGGGHFVVTQDDIIVHSGTSGSMQSIGYSRIIRDFFREVSAEHYQKSYTYKDDFNNEIVICFAPEGESEVSRAWAWNWSDNTFAPRDDLSGFHYIAQGSYTPQDALDTWDTAVGVWATDIAPWNTFTNTKRLRILLAAGDESLYRFDAEHTEGETETEQSLERTDFHFTADKDGNPIPAPDHFKFYRSMAPQINAPMGTEFEIQFGYRDEVGEDKPINWFPPKRFKLRRGVRVWILRRTRFLSWRISCMTSTAWTCSGYLIEQDLRGRN
jgi:hypothetical protein